MSRHIQTADPESRKLNNLTQNGKLILTYIKEKAVALLLRDDMLISVQVIDNTDTLQVGEVYIGKISVIDSETNSPIVIDWRAPFSSLFYDFDKNVNTALNASFTDARGWLSGISVG